MNIKCIKQKDQKIQRGVRDTVDGDRNAHCTRTPAEEERQNDSLDVSLSPLSFWYQHPSTLYPVAMEQRVMPGPVGQSVLGDLATVGGEEGRAEELAQAAGTTGAHSPRSPGELHLKFRTASALHGERTLQEGERPPTTSCTWAEWSHLPPLGCEGVQLVFIPGRKVIPSW